MFQTKRSKDIIEKNIDIVPGTDFFALAEDLNKMNIEWYQTDKRAKAFIQADENNYKITLFWVGNDKDFYDHELDQIDKCKKKFSPKSEIIKYSIWGIQKELVDDNMEKLIKEFVSSKLATLKNHKIAGINLELEMLISDKNKESVKILVEKHLKEIWEDIDSIKFED